MDQQRWQQFYQPPASPLARLGLVLGGIGILALSFVLGLFVLAIAMGLALVGAVVLAVRRLLLGRAGTVEPEERGPLHVEYRVVHREPERGEPERGERERRDSDQ